MDDVLLAKKQMYTNGRGKTRMSRSAQGTGQVIIPDKTTTDEPYIYKILKKKKKRKDQKPEDVEREPYWVLKVPYRTQELTQKGQRRRKYFQMHRLVDMSCPDEIPKFLIKQRDEWLKLPEVEMITKQPSSNPIDSKWDIKQWVISEAWNEEDQQAFVDSFKRFDKD